MGIYKKAPSKRKNIQPPEVPSATYPGERVQVDVKFFPFKIKLVQTDNGFELTNKLSWNAFNKNKETLFEKRLKELKIEYHTIQPHTQRKMEKLREVIEKIKRDFIIKGYL